MRFNAFRLMAGKICKLGHNQEAAVLNVPQSRGYLFDFILNAADNLKGIVEVDHGKNSPERGSESA